VARSTLEPEASIVQLEKLLAQRRTRLASMLKRRAAIERTLRSLDEEIRAIGGGTAGLRAVRARNEVSLITAIQNVLEAAGKPLRVGEILDGVLESGYRSTSPNFRAIVNQTLIKEKQFVATQRGMYKYDGRKSGS
jgi:hypothetical protein